MSRNDHITDEAILAEANRQTEKAGLAGVFGINESTFRRLCRKRGIWGQVEIALSNEPPQPAAPGATTNPDGTMTVISVAEPAGQSKHTVDSLLAAHGLDPADWRVKSARPNAWNALTSDKAHGDNRVVTMHQLKLELVPVDALVAIPDPGAWTPPRKPRKKAKRAERTALVVSDHHAPHHEPEFHAYTLAFMRDEQPDRIEVNGDLGDYATISRHRNRDGYTQSVNECLQASFEILADYRAACPDAEIVFKRGNHDERLRHAILDAARDMHNVKPAGEEIPALDLRRLLRLDELSVEYVDVEWDQAKTHLSRKLTARHGFSTAKNAGEAMLDKLSGSTIQGHDHRFSMTLRTEHTGDPEEPLRVRMAISGGCCCKIPGGLGYIPGGEPNWQNAWAFFRIWESGDFHASPGIYVPGRLLAPNGKRYAE